MRRLTTLAAGLLGLSLITSAMAFEPGQRPDHLPEPAEMAERMAEHLGLDEATQATVEAILAEGRVKTQGELETLQALRAEVQELRASDKRDPRRLKTIVHQMADIRADLELHRMAIHDEIESLLTPEQAEKFKAARARRHHGPPTGPGGERGGRGPRHLDDQL